MSSGPLIFNAAPNIIAQAKQIIDARLRLRPV
jgi:hypothetical protein